MPDPSAWALREAAEQMESPRLLDIAKALDAAEQRGREESAEGIERLRQKCAALEDLLRAMPDKQREENG